MQHRAFVLLPLLEIEPACVIAGFGLAREAMSLCENQQVERVSDAV
jgi:7,8-dihydro-6-hydroxymethylpterin-pyrophosphokinase